MSDVMKRSILCFVLSLCLCISDVAPLLQYRPYRGSNHPELQSREKKAKGSAETGHRHHEDHGKTWNHQDEGSHLRAEDGVKKNKKGAHWDNYGESEKVIKDKGHGFIKAFSWDREEVKKNKWGEKGGRYNEGYEKDRKTDQAKHHKESSGREKWAAQQKHKHHRDFDDSAWTALPADGNEDLYGGLSWQDVQALI